MTVRLPRPTRVSVARRRGLRRATTPTHERERAATRRRRRTTHAPDLAGYRFTVVPHTHWDREWYLPFEVFRMRLARTIDEIIDVLESDPEFRHFTLDGQAVILEDYLELRPENEHRLRALLTAGRVSSGPAYVLPDEYLSGQESLVRNFLMGRRVCERYGTRPMDVGYMPDTFGHVAQLPQILRGFGLDTFVFWRGLGDEGDGVGAHFRWQAPDGSDVLAIRQLGSYGNADELGRWTGEGPRVDDPERWPQIAADRFVRFVRTHGREIRRSRSVDLLLCNGSDHQSIQSDLPALLAHARRVHPRAHMRIGSYEEYVTAVRATRNGHRHLATVSHELCAGRDAPVLRGVNSTRMHLKQANERTERALLVAETLASLASLKTGWRYPAAELQRAWRELLRNLPHDSISGCSVDEVANDMAARFAVAGHLAERVRREALSALANDTERWSYRPVPADSLSIVNPLPWRRTGVVDLAMPESLADARSLVAEPAAGDAGVQVDRSTNRSRVRVVATVNGFGAVQVGLKRGRKRGDAGRARASRTEAAAVLENEFYRVRVARDGQLTVRDLRTGRVRRGLHVFEDQADRGDLYNFQPLEGDRVRTTRGAEGQLRVVSRGPLIAEVEWRYTARIPRGLTANRLSRVRQSVRCPIVTRIRLVAGVERIEFQTTVGNAAEDHRLRVRFSASDAETDVRAEGHFSVIRRPTTPNWSGGGWSEPPSLTHHTSGFVAADELVVFGRGLPEYEAIARPNGGVDVALTLLRCVGWLSRDDLTTRPGHAGPGLSTPGAQCPGTHTFEYAISFGGRTSDAELVRASADYRTPLVVGPAGADPSGVVQLDGAGYAFAALKQAEDGEGAVVRLYNPADRPANVRVAAHSATIRRCRLDETQVEQSEWRGGALRPGEIVTARITP